MAERGRARFAAFAALLAVAATLVVLLSKGGEDPAVAAASASVVGSSDGAGASPVAAASAGPASEAAIERRAAGRARVVVVVGDGVGHPLREIDVGLQRTGTAPTRPRTLPLAPAGVGGSLPVLRSQDELAEPFPARRGRSGDDGRFVFDDIAPGEYRATADSWVLVEEVVTVPDSGEIVVPLRFPRDLVLVEVAVRAPPGPVPPPLTFRGPGSTDELLAHPGSDGVQRQLLSPGDWTVVAWGHPGQGSGPRLRPGRVRATSCIAARRAFHVAAGAPVVRVELTVPDLRVQVSLDDGGLLPVRALRFVLSRQADADSEAIEVVGGGGDGRSAEFTDLGLGRWTVHARAPELVLGPPEVVEFGPDSGPVAVTLRATPGGVVRLVARDGRGPLLADGGTPLRLWTTAGELSGRDLETGRPGGRLDGSFGFVSVPIGRAELRCDDPVTDGVVAFLPFRTPLSVPVDVVAGDQNRVELQLERRAFVSLRAVDAGGRDDFTLISLEVRDGERRVRSGDPKPTRFRSPMPPGDYLVTVQRRGQPTRTERLLVGTADIERLLRP